MRKRLKTGGAPERSGPGWRLSLILAVLALCAWEALSRTGVVSRMFFPPPTVILHTVGRLTANGELPSNVLVTLGRILAGFLLGAIPAVLLGMFMGWSPRLRGVADPFIAAFHPMPKTSLLPIFMILLGLGEAPKVAVAAMGAFFPLLINSMAGVRQISPIHFEVAANYRANAFQVLRHVVLPGSSPLILTGARLAFNTALHIVLSVELLTARKGLGALIWFAWETMRTETLYAAVAVSAVLGIVFNILLKHASKRWVPWQTERKI